MQPKVSVIIPVYNTSAYLRECLNSAIEQTLRDIEIICVNDGSTDNSIDILREYANRDNRISIIDKPNSGYGHTMNCGLNAAKGEYVAFLESDDTIGREAYEKLVSIADENSLDIVKGDYYELRGIGGDRELLPISLSKNLERYNTIVRPQDEPWAFYMPMMNWLGLIRKDLIDNYGIRHNETPGAAHQDMGFWFQTLAAANSLMFVSEPFYEYRQDNMNASMKSDKTTFSTLDEYSFIYAFLERYPKIKEKVLPVFFHRKYTSAMFSFGRAELSLRLPFLRKLAEEFEYDIDKGEFHFERFTQSQSSQLKAILDDVDDFYIASLEKDGRKTFSALKDEVSSLRLQMENVNKARERAGFPEKPDDSRSKCLLSYIVIVEYGEDFQGTLDSICSQSGDFEVICVDNCADEAARTSLEAYASGKQDIQLIHTENLGRGFLANLGMDAASGQVLQFVSAPDTVSCRHFEAIRSVLGSKGLDVAIFETAYLSPDSTDVEDSQVPPAEKAPDVSKGSTIYSGLSAKKAFAINPFSAVFDRRYLNEKGLSFIEDLNIEDKAFAIKAICQADHAAMLEDTLYFHSKKRATAALLQFKPKVARSLFEIYYDILMFSSETALDFSTAKKISEALDMILNRLQKSYKGLSVPQKAAVRTLPPIQETLMDVLLTDITQKSDIEDLKKKLSREKKKNKKLLHSSSWRIGKKVADLGRPLKKIIGK